MTADNQRFKLLAFHGVLYKRRNHTVMPAGFIVEVALRMTGVVPGVSIAAAVARCGVADGPLLSDLVEIDIQKTCVLTVNQRDPQARILRKNRRQRFEMKPAVHK